MNDIDQCICDSCPVPPVPRRCHRETAPGKAFCASCLTRSCAHHHGIGAEPLPADQAEVRAALVAVLHGELGQHVTERLADAILADPRLTVALRSKR